MTNKTTYAMFAVAAIAAISFGFTPAFATTIGTTVNTTADTAKDGIAACGSDFLITRVTPNSSQDYVSVMTSGNDCSSFSKVTVSLYVENTWKGTVSTTDSYKVFNFNTSGLDAGDKVRVVTTWNY